MLYFTNKRGNYLVVNKKSLFVLPKSRNKR